MEEPTTTEVDKGPIMNPLYTYIDKRISNLGFTVANSAAQTAVTASFTKSFSTQNTGYAAANTDVGGIISVSSGNVFITVKAHNPGDQIHIYNANSTNTLTITQNTGVTIHFPNTTNVTASSLSGNRILAPRGFATLTCVAPNTYVISTGSGVF